MRKTWKLGKAALFVAVVLLAGVALPSNSLAKGVAGVTSAGSTLIDVDFGAQQSPGLEGNKVGLAATGLTTNDFWNFYSRDDGQGHWLVNGVLPNLELADGSTSSVGLLVNNAPGCWGDSSSDPMYNSYIYPFDGGNVTVTVTNLTEGQYDFYVYGPDGNYQLAVGATDYGVKTTTDNPVINPPVWQEGRQYVLYQGVSVGTGQGVTLTVRPGVGGYAVISGMQIISASVVTGTPPNIVTQPASQTAVVGAGVTFTVTANGTLPFNYQWRRCGQELAGATGSALVLANVQSTNAGRYSVVVSNLYGSVLSSNATLAVVPGGSGTLIDVDFGAGPAASGTPETGPAAVGQATNDFWNFYTRDDGSGGWRSFGALSSLKLANGAVSSVGMTVLNAPGCWWDNSSDAMYNSYIYPFDGGNVTVTVTNLAEGQYDFYVYGPDGNYQLAVGTTDYGIKTTLDQRLANPPVWQTGRQYALYQGVTVGAGQGVSLTVRPGVYGYAVISGLQISSGGAVIGTPPSIVTQPLSQTVVAGSGVAFAVTAAGTEPLSYQWRLGGTDLAGATNSMLELANVQSTNAGRYSVLVSNLYGSVLSSNATLAVVPGRSGTLIDVDFGAGPASSGTPKTGPAAVGQAANDFWNFYTRDDGSGGWRSVGALSSLKFANGAVSSVGMTVLNAPGCWADNSSDPMYNSYIYPFNGGNVTVTVTNLAAGQYDFYVYGPDGNYRLAVGSTNFGVKTTADQPLANPPVWQAGRQYALFQDVSVGTEQSVTLTVRPGVGGYAVISGLQISSASVVTGTPPSIVTQPQSRTVGVGLGVTFTVTAAGTEPLSYQWQLGGTDLEGATGSALALLNVQPAVAGDYSVWVTNLYGSVLSSNATLTVVQGAPNTLLNVDFGAGPASSGTPETGPAATGQATNDFWNFYTRDDDSGGWRSFGTLSSLKFANGAVSSVGMTVLNAPGCWWDNSSDAMYNSYIYPFDGGNITVTVTNLPAGQYDFYVYGPDGDYQLAVDATDYGVETALDQALANPPAWQAGQQYALYQGVSVGTGQDLTLTVRPGVGGYAVISGMQIVLTATASQPQRQTAQLKIRSIPKSLAGSQVQIELLGIPNHVYAVQASTTLMKWVTIGICGTDANGYATLADPTAVKYPSRLYRVVEQ